MKTKKTFISTIAVQLLLATLFLQGCNNGTEPTPLTPTQTNMIACDGHCNKQSESGCEEGADLGGSTPGVLSPDRKSKTGVTAIRSESKKGDYLCQRVPSCLPNIPRRPKSMVASSVQLPSVPLI